MLNVDKLKAAMTKTADEARKQLDELRGKIQQIDDELHWLEHSPMPLADALKNINDFVDQQSGLAGIQHFFYQSQRACEGPFEVRAEFDNDNPLTVLETGQAIGAGKVDLSSVICSLFGETVKRRLSDMATAAAEGIESGPPLNERPGLKRELLKTRRELEIDEEKIISAAEELGLYGFFRRSDCDPEIVLMVA